MFVDARDKAVEYGRSGWSYACIGNPSLVKSISSERKFITREKQVDWLVCLFFLIEKNVWNYLQV
jgi:hypothetical protein